MLRRFLVCIAGPSGSGKTTIASTLCAVDQTYAILRNYTTRVPRPTDPTGHFGYLSEHRFQEAYIQGEFFLCRLGSPPRYGYKANELVDIISDRRRPVLMFRHSGTKYLAKSLGGVPTIFIEGNPKKITRRSQRKDSPPTEEEVKKTIRGNRQLQKLMKQRGWPYLCVINHYAGKDELNAIAQRIREFLSAADGY